MKKTNILVHYLRYWDKEPFGCLVAIDTENVGISICSPKDKFNKKRAVEIALGRALLKSNDLSVVPNRAIAGYYGDNYRTWDDPPQLMKDYVRESVELIKQRAKKFFKDGGES